MLQNFRFIDTFSAEFECGLFFACVCALFSSFSALLYSTVDSELSQQTKTMFDKLMYNCTQRHLNCFIVSTLFKIENFSKPKHFKKQIILHFVYFTVGPLMFCGGHSFRSCLCTILSDDFACQKSIDTTTITRIELMKKTCLETITIKTHKKLII